MIDYEVLRFIWWLLVGVLLIGFAVTDGFDMGVGMLTRFLGRNDTERRIMINSIAFRNGCFRSEWFRHNRRRV